MQGACNRSRGRLSRTCKFNGPHPLVTCFLQDMVSLKDQAEAADELASHEEDLLSLLEALHRLCDPSLPFHVTNRDADLPTPRVDEYASEYAVPSCPAGAGSASDSPSEVEEISVPQHVWLSNLLNAFGCKYGFQLICKVCGRYAECTGLSCSAFQIRHVACRALGSCDQALQRSSAPWHFGACSSCACWSDQH